jgi:hypothetical protein
MSNDQKRVEMLSIEDDIYNNPHKYQKYLKNINTTIMGWGELEIDNSEIVTRTQINSQRLKKLSEILETIRIYG